MATNAYKVLLKDKDGNQLLPRTKAELVEGLSDQLAGKQDVISDLGTIRSNASKGAGLESQVNTNKSDIAGLKTSVDALSGAFQWKGKFDTLPDVSGYAEGNVVTVGTKEYVATKSGADSALTWEEFGDEGSYVAKTTYDTKVSELETAIGKKQDALTFDSTPTAGSSNPVTSAGIKTAIESATKDIASSETVSDINSRLKTAETKLATIDENADVNVLEGVQVNGTDLAITDKKVNVDLSEYAKSEDVEPILVSLSQYTVGTGYYYVIRQSEYNEIIAAVVSGIPVTILDNGTTYNVIHYDGSKVYAGAYLLWENKNIQFLVIYGSNIVNQGDDPYIRVLFETLDFSGYQSKLTFDSAPTANSTNPVTSGGVSSALSGKQDTISDLATIRSNASTGAGLSSQVNTNKTNIATNTTDISNLKTSVSTNSSAIETLQASGVFYTKGEAVTALAE